MFEMIKRRYVIERRFSRKGERIEESRERYIEVGKRLNRGRGTP